MTEFPPTHQVVVFVYCRLSDGPKYLVVRMAPRLEGLWRPVVGTVRPEEVLESAAVREVRQETGIICPKALLDFGFRHREQVGDFEMVDWGLGYDAGNRLPQIQLGGDYRDYRWLEFDQAYRTIEVASFREAVLKLHVQIAG